MNYSDSELIWVFNRSRGRCLYCGGEISYHAHRAFGEPHAWVVDMFIPPEKGGTNQIFNWVAACPVCSHEKGMQLPWEFDPERFGVGVMDPDNSALMSLMKDRGAGGVEDTAVVPEKQVVHYRPDEI